MLVLDLLEFLVSIVWFVVDFPARRKRIVKIGLCAAHRRNYFLCRRGAWVAAGLTIPLLAVAFFVPLREPWASLTLFVGLPMLFAAIFLPWGAPALRLVSEKAGNMWIVGAGKGFLKLYPDFPARSK